MGGVSRIGVMMGCVIVGYEVGILSVDSLILLMEECVGTTVGMGGGT